MDANTSQALQNSMNNHYHSWKPRNPPETVNLGQGKCYIELCECGAYRTTLKPRRVK